MSLPTPDRPADKSGEAARPQPTVQPSPNSVSPAGDCDDTWSQQPPDASTHDFSGVPECHPPEDAPIPATVGRYQIKQRLGGGGFGDVYLAHDPKLQKDVALKVPNSRWQAREASARELLAEARLAAGLEHPHVIPIYDVQDDSAPPFIVMKFIAGLPLNKWVKDRRPGPRQIVNLMIDISNAVGFAHRQGMIHRDLKPANILVDFDGRPFVGDFGLAVKVESRSALQAGAAAGTCPYMAPEQVRGEGHRLDSRTDIWALGVILYDLFTGKRPFAGETVRDEIENILSSDPPPPRMMSPEIPVELERICLKCLQKRRTDRYTTTADLIDDLRHWLDSTEDIKSSRPSPVIPTDDPIKIIPKGLRSFDQHDKDFFLELLPGPRDRSGLPDGIRFWKTRIEQYDPEQTFSVGLIYGPSGCGKSSLVKAGLLPRLSPTVNVVYLEATSHDTEHDLLRRIRKSRPEIHSVDSLPDALRYVRSLPNSSSKLLLILDQFEQWLLAHDPAGEHDLITALRQCDGGKVQCILMVRDDFWLGTSRFMRQLEVPLVEGHNSAMVDRFDLDHAAKVLTAFGRAFGKLTDPPAQLTTDQQRFLELALHQLAEDDRVISVRLSLFAEMLKGKPWTLSTLANVEGVEGIGVRFLEEQFRGSSAHPEHRRQEPAARAVLELLLPDVGTHIKGGRRSEGELRERAQSVSRAIDFNRLLMTLNGELKLITPVDVEDPAPHAEKSNDMKSVTESVTPGSAYYQLTHDYLVPSLRRWLRKRDAESCRGRARLRLADRSSLWSSHPEVQQLPKWWEYFGILAITRWHEWSGPQRSMMSSAHRYYVTRMALLVAVLMLLAISARELFSRGRARTLVDQLVTAGDDGVLQTSAQLRAYLPWARAQLSDLTNSAGENDTDRKKSLHARIALVTEDPSQVPALLDSLLTESVSYFGPIRDALYDVRADIAETLWNVVHDDREDANRRLRAAIALARYQPDSKLWQPSDYEFLASHILLENPKDQPGWLKYLGPHGQECLPYWQRAFSDPESSETTKLGATNAIVEFAGDDPVRIAELLAVADPRQYKILFPLLNADRSMAPKTRLRDLAAELPQDQMSSVDRVAFGRRRAGAGITLLKLGEWDSAGRAFEMSDDPEAITQFIHGCRDRDVGGQDLLELLRFTTQYHADRRLQANVRRAVLMALGDFALEELPASDRESLLRELADWYAQDPSAAVHSAAGWLLRQWNQLDVVRRIDQTPIPYSADREWFTLALQVTPRVKRPPTTESPETSDEAKGGEEPAVAETSSASNDAASQDVAAYDAALDDATDAEQTFFMTFVVIPAGDYWIGSVDGEPVRQNEEIRHRVSIKSPFAMLDREVTFEELIAFNPLFETFMQQYSAQPAEAAFAPMWYEAVEYCRWLSQQAGLEESQQSYATVEEMDALHAIREPSPEAAWAPRNWAIRLNRSGFRLPTEAEWELACRAGVRTTYAFGSDSNLLPHYAWTSQNCKQVQPPKMRRPGLNGLFDMHGNLWEWCHDWHSPYAADGAVDPLGPEAGTIRINRGGSWDHDAANCRASIRFGAPPTNRNLILGFRLVMNPSVQKDRVQ